MRRLVGSIESHPKEQRTEKESEMSKLFQNICTLSEENKLFKREIETLKSASAKQNNLIGGFQDEVEKFNVFTLLSGASNLGITETASTASTEYTEEQENTSSESEDLSYDDWSEQKASVVIKKHKTKIRLLEEKIKTMESAWNSSNEFIWIIENFSEKRKGLCGETIIYSEPFFSHPNGYRLRLHMYPKGKDGHGRTLSLCFSLMKGIYDDILKWPFRHDVLISLINQSTGLDYKTKISQYKNSPRNPAFRKPVRDVNHEKSFWNFIMWSDVENSSYLYCQDRIFIKCFVKLNN